MEWMNCVCVCVHLIHYIMYSVLHPQREEKVELVKCIIIMCVQEKEVDLLRKRVCVCAVHDACLSVWCK